MSTRGIKFNFLPGESVLCFEPDPTKARVIYEAKILDTTVYKDLDGKKKPGYHIHFLRWNNSWDRIVGEQLVLKSSEENKTLMKQLSEVARKFKNKKRRKRIHEILTEAFNGSPPFEDVENEEENTTDTNDTEDESTAETDSIGSESKGEDLRKSQRLHPQVDIEIPDSLKAVLDKDYFAINQDKKVVKLPADINVVTVLESFVKTFMMDFWSTNYDRSYLCHNPPKIAIDRILPMCKEFVDGLRICFDFVLPVTLLYEGEKDQHLKIMNTFKSKSPAKQKIPGEDSPLLRSPRSRTSDQHNVDEPWPKLPKLSPNVVDEDDEITFDIQTTPRRVTRSRVPDLPKKSENERINVKTEQKEHQNGGKSCSKNDAKLIRKRRSSDRQDEGLRRRALRSYRKSSEDSSDSEQSKPETIMSEPAKPVVKIEKNERPPPLLIPCNISGARQNGADKNPEKGAPDSTDSLGDNGREEILANILHWQLAPPEALSKLPTPPCMIYGSQHLLRLFVKLPQLLSEMDLDEDRLGVVKKLVQQFLQYMSEHLTELFPESVYVAASD
ncbi:male-specific lethal 3 homolog isoform X2 [Ruditapes philippinarum]|uniref:male-specific lethal 3 homolog isoform X2 n=1 Tax=Ruditapes philippinarum TaxID=129788 RepID=UPI00295ACC4B|nr:male-specific lethal 3 homolog isoform X2 [Ruditapes philippinarum]